MSTPAPETPTTSAPAVAPATLITTPEGVRAVARHYALWEKYGPGTLQLLSYRSFVPVDQLDAQRPALMDLGLLALVGQSPTGPVYGAIVRDGTPPDPAAATRQLNAPTAQDEASRGAALLALHGKKAKAARANPRDQSEMALTSTE